MREASHLIARFFDVLSAPPLRPAEQAEVAALLRSSEEQKMFWEQPAADQRHGLGAARHVAAQLSSRTELIRAALLHDVGKRHARLGIVGRVIASLIGGAGRRGRGRVRQYLEHGVLGAGDLEGCGAELVVVEYARAHHGPRPASIAVGDWEILAAADRVRR